MTDLVKKLEAIGGKLWESHGKRRVYFNIKNKLNNYGYDVRNNQYNGEYISKREGKALLEYARELKIYVDLDNDNELVVQNRQKVYRMDYIGIIDEMLCKLIDEIKQANQ